MEEDYSEEDSIVQNILKLPSAPIYMSIIRTLKGKPVGIPIWNSFENKEFERSMNNESMASTFLQLAKKISDLATPSKNGNVIKVSLDNRTYNIYHPTPNSSFQFSFVVVFEQSDKVLVEDKYKEELVRLIVKALSKNKEFLDFVHSEHLVQILKDNPLHKQIEEIIIKQVSDWDSKRIKYLEKQYKKERDRIKKEVQKQLKESREED